MDSIGLSSLPGSVPHAISDDALDSANANNHLTDIQNAIENFDTVLPYEGNIAVGAGQIQNNIKSKLASREASNNKVTKF